MNIYYQPQVSEQGVETYRTYIVPDNYCKTLAYIKEIVAQCPNWNITPPEDEKIEIRILAGERHKRCLSVEFISTTEPNTGYKLEINSPLYEWLVTP